MDLKEYLEKNPQLNRFSFGNFMRQRRMELGYGVVALSKIIDVTPSYISDIEKGNRNAPITMLENLSRLLLVAEEDMQDFVDLAYLSRETCAPDLIQYLIAHKEARLAIRYLKEKNISGTKLLEIVTQNDENFKKL